MRKIVSIFTVFMVIFIGLMSVSAADGIDDRGSPNDPTVNERANACFEGGSMFGKCLTDWDWNCGWYAIRFEENQLTRESFPVQCAALLPATSPPSMSLSVDESIERNPRCFYGWSNDGQGTTTYDVDAFWDVAYPNQGVAQIEVRASDAGPVLDGTTGAVASSSTSGTLNSVNPASTSATLRLFDTSDQLIVEVSCVIPQEN